MVMDRVKRTLLSSTSWVNSEELLNLPAKSLKAVLLFKKDKKDKKKLTVKTKTIIKVNSLYDIQKIKKGEKERRTEAWNWQEPSGLSSSVNMALHPIRWHWSLVADPTSIISLLCQWSFVCAPDDDKPLPVQTCLNKIRKVQINHHWHQLHIVRARRLPWWDVSYNSKPILLQLSASAHGIGEVKKIRDDVMILWASIWAFAFCLSNY